MALQSRVSRPNTFLLSPLLHDSPQQPQEMAIFDCLSLPLTSSLPETCRLDIARHLWDLDPPLSSALSLQHDQTALVDELLRLHFWQDGYYLQLCSLASNSSANSSIKSHRDLVEVAKLLRQPGITKQNLLEQVAQLFGDPALNHPMQHSMSITLATRAILMIKVGLFPDECIVGFQKNQQPLDWESGTLEDFVHHHFLSQQRSPQKGQSEQRLKLEKSFNALNLHRIAGIEIKWTDNLADHLKMMNDDKTVAIFRHASFLHVQKDSPMYPPGLINETIQTLALLFPQDDRPTRAWLQKASKALRVPLDRHLISTGYLLGAQERNFDTFDFWNDRLVVLKQVYNEHRPATILQWWYDDRNPAEWYTVWTAVLVIFLTLFFGFIGNILAGIQVFLALKALSSSDNCSCPS